MIEMKLRCSRCGDIFLVKDFQLYNFYFKKNKCLCSKCFTEFIKCIMK